MSQRIGNSFIIAREPRSKYELCGKIDELRPYGPRGENICYECGMRDEAVTARQCQRVLFGNSVQ
jgi:hypothetical protein